MDGIEKAFKLDYCINNGEVGTKGLYNILGNI